MHVPIAESTLALVLEHCPPLAVLLEAQLAFGIATLEHVYSGLPTAAGPLWDHLP